MSTPRRERTLSLRLCCIPSMGNALRYLRLKKGWTHEEAGGAMGVSRSQFIKLERGERRLTEDTIGRAAKAFEVTPADVMSGPSIVPVVGYAGAGGVSLYSDGFGPSEDPIEADAPEGTVAVRIRGVSLGIGFDGWLALYAERRDPFTADLLGKLCVVGTVDGRTLVKWVRRSLVKGAVDLVSGVGEIEESVSLSWAARVIDLRPA